MSGHQAGVLLYLSRLGGAGDAPTSYGIPAICGPNLASPLVAELKLTYVGVVAFRGEGGDTPWGNTSVVSRSRVIMSGNKPPPDHQTPISSSRDYLYELPAKRDHKVGTGREVLSLISLVRWSAR